MSKTLTFLDWIISGLNLPIAIGIVSVIMLIGAVIVDWLMGPSNEPFLHMLCEQVRSYKDHQSAARASTRVVLHTTHGDASLSLEPMDDPTMLRIKHSMPDLSPWLSLEVSQSTDGLLRVRVGDTTHLFDQDELRNLWGVEVLDLASGDEMVMGNAVCTVTLRNLEDDTFSTLVAPRVIVAINWIDELVGALPATLFEALLGLITSARDNNIGLSVWREVEASLERDPNMQEALQEVLAYGSVSEVVRLLSIPPNPSALFLERVEAAQWNPVRRMAVVHAYRVSQPEQAPLNIEHVMAHAPPALRAQVEALTLQDILGPLGSTSPGSLLPVIARHWVADPGGRDALNQRVEHTVDQMPTPDIFAWLSALEAHGATPLLTPARVRGLDPEQLTDSTRDTFVGWMMQHVQSEPSLLREDVWVDALVPLCVWMSAQDVQRVAGWLQSHGTAHALSVLGATLRRVPAAHAPALERAQQALRQRYARAGGVSLSEHVEAGGLSVSSASEPGGLTLKGDLAPHEDSESSS